jgi:hypothetical protein
VRQGVRGRSVRPVVSHHGHADAQRFQPGIIERADVEMMRAARDEHVRRSIIWLCREHGVDAGGKAHHDVAAAGLECVAEKAAALRPPGVLDMGMKIAGQQLGNPVLESFPTLIRERQIVGIGTHAQRRRSA